MFKYYIKKLLINCIPIPSYRRRLRKMMLHRKSYLVGRESICKKIGSNTVAMPKELDGAIDCHIHIMQRRVKGQDELTHTQKCRNRAISKRRCRIEHIFGIIKQFGGDEFRGVGLKRCKIRQGLVFLLYNMKRFCFLNRMGLLCPAGSN